MNVFPTKKQSRQGLTLIELIVVIFIFAVVSSILIFNYSDFSTNISVRNLSQEVALSIRKAQTLATSVQGGDPVNPFSATTGYGIYVSLAEQVRFGGGEKSFVLFRDINNDGLYNQTTQSCGVPTIENECLERFLITTGDVIHRICVDDVCDAQTGAILYFRRPNPDARLYFDTNASSLRSRIDIELMSAKGMKKTVRVWNTGQIGVLP